MNAALFGVLACFILGVLGIISTRARFFALLAPGAGAVCLALWAPGFPEALLGGPPWGVTIVGDRWALGLWVLALSLHVAVLLHGWRKGPLFHALITVLLGTSLAGAISTDLFNLYVVLELASLLSVILVAKEEESAAVWAALRYLILAGVGMTLYLFGLGLVYGRTGTLSLSALSRVGFSDQVLRIGVGFLLAGAAIKTGVFLLGPWLPPAHGRAPTEVSALLSGLVVKIGVVTIARLAEAFPISSYLLALGILTGFGGLVYAFWEQDLKLLLAHSTVSQLGYIFIGLGFGAQEGALVYAVAHGLIKGLLFLCAGEGVESTGKRTIPDLAGNLPLPAALGLALGSWAIVGLPPLVGYAAKSALSLGMPAWGKAILLLLALGTAALFARLFPLFRPRGRGRLGGIPWLSLTLIGGGLWGLFVYRPLLSPRAWAEAFVVVGLGFLCERLLRRTQPALPRLGLEEATLASFLGALGLTAIVAFL